MFDHKCKEIVKGFVIQKGFEIRNINYMGTSEGRDTGC